MKRLYDKYKKLHDMMIGLPDDEFERVYRRFMANDSGTDDLQDCAGIPSSGDD